MRNLRGRTGPGLATALCLLVGGAVAASPRALAPGDKAPALAAPALGGTAERRVDWAEASFTLVNFWATWCEPCRTEMPRVDALQTKYEAAGLKVYGVLIDRAGDETASRFVTERGVRYTMLRGNTQLSDRWGGIGVIPTTFLVDAGGKIRGRYVGATEETILRLETDVARLLTPPGGPGQPMPIKPEPTEGAAGEQSGR